MKCPFKFGRYKFEGGEECHKDCAWRMTYDYTSRGMDRPAESSCAIAVLAHKADGQRDMLFEEEER